jgi:hypothetical protein
VNRGEQFRDRVASAWLAYKDAECALDLLRKDAVARSHGTQQSDGVQAIQNAGADKTKALEVYREVVQEYCDYLMEPNRGESPAP